MKLQVHVDPWQLVFHPHPLPHSVLLLQVVNVLSLWSILLLADYTLLSTTQTLVFLGVATATISYEVALGIIRVQDYYYTKHSRYMYMY